MCTNLLIRSIVICGIFIVPHVLSAPPTQEPQIYFSIARWENRTFSPRLIYMMLLRSQKHKKQNLVDPEHQIVPQYPPGTNKISDDEPFFAFRNGFGKPITPGSLGGGGLLDSEIVAESKPVVVVDTKEAEDGAMFTEYDDDSIIMFGSNQNHHQNMTTEAPPTSDEGGIVFDLQSEVPELANRHETPPSKLNEDWSDGDEKYKRICGTKGRPYDGSPVASSSRKSGLDLMDFTFKIFKSSNSREGNLIFSPLSIANILTLLFLGSGGTSHLELGRLLGAQTDRDNVYHSSFSDAIYAMLNCHSPVVLESANKIFTDKNYPFFEEYAEMAKSLYGADVERFDFRQGEEFPDLANEWIKEHTRGHIQGVVDSVPSPLTTLVMLNALYFKGEWDSPFEPQLTRSNVFYVNDNDTVPVQMMTNVMTIPHIETECYQMIRLPYYGNDTSMFVILPVESGIPYLQRVERELTSEIVQDNIRHLNGIYPPPKAVTVKLPKLHIESFGHMRSILEDVGLETVFDQRFANFSNLSPAEGLHVNSLMHKAVLDIDETGSEGSAVSIATVDRIIGSAPVLFNVNRPFIFFIYNHFANVTLFWGRVTDPQGRF